MKTTLATLAAVLVFAGLAAAQQTRSQPSTSRPDAATMTTATNANVGTGNTLEQNSNGSVTTGASGNASTNSVRPAPSDNPNNGTNATTGLNGTLEQNSNGTVSANAPTTTTTDARSSTITNAPTTKARRKRSELVNLKKNQ